MSKNVKISDKSIIRKVVGEQGFFCVAVEKNESDLAVTVSHPELTELKQADSAEIADTLITAGKLILSLTTPKKTRNRVPKEDTSKEDTSKGVKKIEKKAKAKN